MRRRRLFHDVLERYRRRHRVVEGHRAGEQLVQNHAQRIEIALRHGVGRTACLLRRDVMRRAEYLAHGALADVERQPEVGQIRLPVAVNHDVGRLHVAVDHPLAVRVIQRAAHRLVDAQQVRRRERLAGLLVQVNQHAQLYTLDELHRHVVQAVRFAEVIHRHDVRMLQRGNRLRLALEARRIAAQVAQVRLDDLERHHAPQRHVHRPVDARHPAASQRAFNLIIAQASAD